MDVTKPIRLSLPKQIADEIEKEIRTGTLLLGSKIPAEPELVKSFGVSRNTIREAIQSLIHAGVLEARQGDGTYVLASGPFEANILKRLSLSAMNEVYEIRLCLEKDIVRLAAERRTDSDLAEMKKALHKREAISLSAKENTDADIEFHMTIARASHNSLFYDLYKHISAYIGRTIRQKVELEKLEGDVVDFLHRKLFAAIQEQDCIKAELTIIELLNL
ncbi:MULTISPECIES: FadR/GntR family transcriptional regulator [unclassified Oceanispirochaeta]|uniref:FadR/GntR family transcriptional regulator n=1 Tax=unclassified Oceanispirochaeta TaxID=2635722 RepID=UPI000E09B944|nr:MULTISPECIES: FadR/GntR family transcriptional regulator [unclassified Oceanispirochaeta]MBF9014649.1 FadR family transcriptional regulator [Oceanispirochaeta sp. M2]NPD70905.1 FadR family transcriptional regulator [Oceanispirochaeta sp. M1]RDG33739.1 FadR family transcriptional regulator [Oceanispirochaeta sp. M1]